VLNGDERDLLSALENKLNKHGLNNRLMQAYYEGHRRLTKLGFSVPPKMADFQTILGWPSIVVDVIEERLKWRGWLLFQENEGTPASRIGKSSISEAQQFFDQTFRDNGLEAEGPMSHLDSLMFGTGFAMVGTRADDDDEETPLITAESSLLTTGIYDPQKRRLSSGVVFRSNEEGEVVRATLLTPDESVYLTRQSIGGMWRIQNRDQHRIGRVLLVPFVNRPTGSRREGRSEITRPIRGYTDIGVRTLLGMEVNREFFMAPQRYVLGATEDDFRDEHGNKVPQWQSVMGRIWGVGRDENGDLPTVGQFDPAPSRPFLEQIQGIAQLVAADAGLPQTYFGFMTDNPASADAIRALESRLIKRSERRISSFGRSWAEVGKLAWMVANKGRKAPTLDTDWGNPATPTQQADADSAMKLVSVDILPARSSITRNRVGLNKTEQQILDREMREEEARKRLEARRSGTLGIPGVPQSNNEGSSNGNAGTGEPPAGSNDRGVPTPLDVARRRGGVTQ
jgi:hypothetical protein